MFYSKGRVTPQAHVNIPEGLVEEEYARNGFFGRSSHLYRTDAPVGWIDIEGDLRPEALKVYQLPQSNQEDYLENRSAFLDNADVRISVAVVRQTMPYFFRNADGDECLFVHRGSGKIETDFGPLNYEKGDYLVIPRGTVYRLHPDQETALLITEAFSEISLPDRGMLGQHALFDPAVIRVPEPDLAANQAGQWAVKVQRLNQISTITYPFYPINTAGWKGNLTVWQLNVSDIRPVISERYHLPPSAHTTFVMNNAVICSFLPRGLETGDPNALRVPFYHSNIDFDEVIFYHDGDFFSRSGIEPGMVTFHPQGIHHGPHPKAIENAKTKTRTEEQAVMIDTRNPLQLTDIAKTVCWQDYWKSWQSPEHNSEGERS